MKLISYELLELIEIKNNTNIVKVPISLAYLYQI